MIPDPSTKTLTLRVSSRRQNLSRRCVVILLLLTYTVFVQEAVAGAMFIPCDSPWVWQGAAVNVVVLEYSFEGAPNPTLTNAAKRLSLLIEINSLFSVLKYGSVSACHFVQPSTSAECTPQELKAMLLGEVQGAEKQLRPGHGLVLLWGRLYGEGDSVFVQSYVSFLRRGVEESLSVSIGGALSANDTSSVLTLSAKLPLQSVAFAPQALSLSEINEIAGSLEYVDVLRTEPTPDAGTIKIHANPDHPFNYAVAEVSGEWMRLESYGGSGRTGWVRGQPFLGGLPLQRKLPELSFVEGVAGYLRFMVSRADSTIPKPPRRTPKWVEEAFDRFVNHKSSSVAYSALAVANSIQGALAILSADSANLATYSESGKKFSAATAFMPQNADLMNLRAISEIGASITEDEADTSLAETTARKRIEARNKLVEAAKNDPANPTVIKNLEMTNRYLLGFSRITSDTAAAEEIRKSLHMSEQALLYNATKQESPTETIEMQKTPKN